MSQILETKPTTTFKVPELANRRAVIASAMTMNKWAGEETEKDIYSLKAQADLAKKFSTEIKNARSRLLGLLEIADGTKALEQSKKRGSWIGGYNKFASPIISEAEKSLLQEACAVLRRLEHDVERAGHDVGKLHEQREAEHKARVKQASDALDRLLFSTLDRRGEVMFLTVQASTEYDWKELVKEAKGKEPLWGKRAIESFQNILRDQKASLARRMADTMKSTGQSAEELAQGIVEKFRHPEIEETHGETANLVTMFLVSERISGN